MDELDTYTSMQELTEEEREMLEAYQEKIKLESGKISSGTVKYDASTGKINGTIHRILYMRVSQLEVDAAPLRLAVDSRSGRSMSKTTAACHGRTAACAAEPAIAATDHLACCGGRSIT